MRKNFFSVGYSDKVCGSKAATCVKLLTRKVFRALIHSKDVKDKCAALAVLHQNFVDGMLTPEQYEARKAQVKRSLPAIFWHATFKDGIRKNVNATGSGLFMLDLDGLDCAPRQFYEERVKPLTTSCDILVCHMTPSTKGLRLVAVLPEGMSIAEAQLWLARELGCEEKLDRSCKDLARASYVVEAGYFFLCKEDRLFQSPSPAEEGEGESLTPGPSPVGSGVDSSENSESSVSSESSPLPTTYKGIPYADIVSEWTAQHGGEPEVGERHKRQLELAYDLLPIVDHNAQLMQAVMPRWGQSESEVKGVCEFACQKWQQVDHTDIDGIVEKLLTHGPQERDTAPDDLRFLSDDLMKRLPLVLQRLVSIEPDRPEMRFALLVSGLALLAVYPRQLKYRYVRGEGEDRYLVLFVVVVGDPSIGKSSIKRALEPLWAPLKEADKAAYKALEEWKKEAGTRSQSERIAARPKDVIRLITLSTTTTQLFDRLKAAEEGGGLTCFIFDEEIDSYLNGKKKGPNSDISLIARKGGERESLSQDFKSIDSTSGCVEHAAFNWVITGTPDQADSMFGVKECTNGFASRFIIALVPDTENGGPLVPELKCYTDEDKALFAAAISHLEKQSGLFILPRLIERMKAWVEQQLREATKAGDEAKKSFCKRACSQAMTCGVMCHLLFGMTKDDEVSDTTLEFAVAMAECILRHKLEEFGEKFVAAHDRGRHAGKDDGKWDYILPLLPANTDITISMLKRYAPSTMSYDAASKALQRWAAAHKLEQPEGIKKGHYRKIA